MNNREIRLQLKSRAYALSQKTELACHVSMSESLDGHFYVLFATTAHLHEAKRCVLRWADKRVPIDAVERHLVSLDRKIRKLQNGVMDGD